VRLWRQHALPARRLCRADMLAMVHIGGRCDRRSAAVL